ncbi:hypothetical protein [Legionella longbeachae]|uniref:hypothetical protein n=1 Tax=Legionella longbeachae TaxID=450 RepID=UPI000A1C0510|nr:hypothetical protein [Legionella longbeachae]ARM34940.1 hypothetical protein B0B39_16095 [Legionella longbeachae]ARM34990.1 hypothetical protein B0B39_16370 [Legionella longbeachae]QEY50889.1 hypothetical protein FQU71_06270 [Legionella longbeachae]
MNIKSTKKHSDEGIFESLARSSKTMKVIGRGTLVMDPQEVVETDKFKRLVASTTKLIEKDK